MHRHFFASLFCCAAISALLAGGQGKKTRGMSDTALLARRVAGMDSRQVPLASAFESALSLAQVPGGIVLMKGCKSVPSTVVIVHGTTLGSVLKSIERADPSYHWIVEDGVVNLLPRRGVPQLLRVKVKTFEVNNAANPSDAANMLFALPEFREGAVHLSLTQGGVQSFLSSGGEQPGAPQGENRRFDLHLENLTVLSALNAIVRANKGGIWIYNERYCNAHGVFNIGFSQ